MKPIEQPPWGHWHELYARTTTPFPLLIQYRNFSDSPISCQKPIRYIDITDFPIPQ